MHFINKGEVEIMHKCLLVVCLMLLAGCVTQDTSTPIIQTVDGPTTAAALTARYMNTVSNCGSDTKPAFLCSGIILRSTVYDARYESWDPSKHSHDVRAVSFSFLRKDNNFPRFWSATNGLIFYPIFDTPAGKLHINVLCLHPIDGGSDNRAEQRCGAYPGVPKSDKCHRLNITTAEQWIAAYTPLPGWGRTCAWDVRDSLNQYAGQNFYQGMRSRWKYSATFSVWNELVLEDWSDNADSQVPIQAFFYTDSNGRNYAKLDKDRYLGKTGISLPLIKITMPTSPSSTAQFQYIAGDQ